MFSDGNGTALGRRLLTIDQVPRHTRVAVVGGGLAGLELAKELERGGCDDVVVFEAGPVGDLDHVNVTHDEDVSLARCFTPTTDEHFHRPYTSASERHYTLNSGLRRRLGGRSMYWHGVVLPIEPWALKEPWWPADVVRDLVESWQGGPSLYEKVMAELEEWQRGGVAKYSGLDKEVQVGGERFTATPNACRKGDGDRWYAYSPLDYWLNGPGRTRRRTGVRFVCDVEVVSVDVRGGRAAGVCARRNGSDEVFQFGADVVVLCTAAVENARLAIQALSEVGALNAPRLGRMADHIVQGFVLKLDSSAGPLPEYLLDTASYMASARTRERSYLRFDVHRPRQGEAIVDVRTTGEQECRPESFVQCPNSGPYPWKPVVHTSMGPRDYEVVSGQRDMMQEFWQALAADLGGPGTPLEFEEFGQQARTNTFVLPEFVDALPVGRPTTWVSLLGTEDHEGGTLPLGSVLDERHQVAGVPNLYAAGPSTFPRLGAANPALTSFALAHRLAAILCA